MKKTIKDFDLNNKYIVPVAFLLITGSLLFSAIAILRFRKELKLHSKSSLP